MLIIKLDQGNLAMSIAESMRLFQPSDYDLIDNFLIFENKNMFKNHLIFGTNSPELKKINLSLSKEICKIICFTDSIKELKKKLKKINLNKFIKKEYKVESENLGNKKEEMIDLIWHKINSKVNLKNPEQIIKIVKIKSKYFLCKKIWQRTDKLSNRHNKNLPETMPTTLSPKLAKAMINLTGLTKGKIVDPFCGAGGILIESAKMKFNTTGHDIDKRAFGKSKLNLLHLGFNKVKLEKKDALKLKGKFNAIVTDLPYGKNSKISKKLLDLYADFFKIAAKHSKIMVVGMQSKTDIDSILGKWKIVDFFEIYIHKSLTKKIYVLET